MGSLINSITKCKCAVCIPFFKAVWFAAESLAIPELLEKVNQEHLLGQSHLGESKTPGSKAHQKIKNLLFCCRFLFH